MSEGILEETVAEKSTPAPEALETASLPVEFKSFPLADALLQAIADMGYKHPTPVQAAVMEPALAGRDLLVQSQTGSGKTAAFGIPLLSRLVPRASKPGKPHALVLLPTRELAYQVAAELRALAGHLKTSVAAIYGGMPIGRQAGALAAGVDVVVGTPGRLLDHIRRQNLNLADIKMVVLDEADEMLSMGFWGDVTELLQLAPATRQTMLFSATLPYEIAKAATQFLQNPERVDLCVDNLTVSGIDHGIVHVVADLPKPRQLLYLLEHVKPTSAIIFCNTRNETELLTKYLLQSGFIAEPISGNLKQKDRERVIERIKSGELRYMVATDIAARGIDINDLSHVFNYSLPEFSEVYLHRVGRTGRIGKLGTAISFVDGKGLNTLSQLEKVFGITFTELVLPAEQEVIHARSKRMIKELSDKAAVAELGQQMQVAQDILVGEQAPQIVAFLLRYYLTNQSELTRGGTQGALPQATAVRDEDTQISQDDEAGNKRRRRRRRSGHSDNANRQRVSKPNARGNAHQGNARSSERAYEIVDAAQLLGLAAPEPVRAASTRAPHHGRVAGKKDKPKGHTSQAAVHTVQNGIEPKAAMPEVTAIDPNMTRIRVNIGFDDGFKGRGAVAKKISALAGLNEGIITEIEARRDHAVLQATSEIADMVLDRVDGAPLGKKVISVERT